ncbi:MULTISPECIES: NUDIX domain-containing protein [Priestia]|uniref:NUDIX domain-containing protein n=1 Tax=Priestia aryabhattai TaxID=412384 RepID=A0ABD7X1E1_PRIAR|nr:NUDIX domain-containing protein [Priestia aryabhattai]KJL06178.1 ADP-ribose pyrophosphatase [Priestia aryabhattai B8W22]MBU3569571.1 NUDIX hydrolase [Priestia aryabhattai]MBY0028452.1 NUDIX hydrolase [Priestia aryabhattai]MED3895466.1 NUDIX domain-containing protein [Priestia aryabhattai]WEA46494.1 NUDIX domain-containing protein [Priestia aryabhattai]
MSNKKAMTNQTKKEYPKPYGYTSDIAVFTIVTEEKEPYKPPKMNLKLMLIQRAMLNAEGEKNSEAGKWALPGGFVHPDESAFEAAKRELEEETGVNDIHLKHYGVYDEPGRDDRGWVITNAHYAIVPEDSLIKRKANDDAARVELFKIDEIFSLPLAFDHEIIIRDAIKEIKKDLLQTTIAQKFLPSQFTYSELQAVLLTVTDDAAIKSDQAFARKIRMLPFIEEVDGKTTTRTSKKPTKLYRFVEMNVMKPIYTARY